MGEPKGPRVDLPDELASELEASGDGSKTHEIPVEVEVDLGGEGSASADPPTEPAEAGEGEPGGEGDVSRAEFEAQNDKLLRLAAEYENFKRRALRERQDVQKFANEHLVKELLATVDNLERALGHAGAAAADSPGDEPAASAAAPDAPSPILLEGVELTYRSLMQTLDKAGVHVVDATGEEFNPEFHEAIRQVESHDHDAGQVTEVYQKGYRLHDRLLRPALVAVSSGKPSA